MDSGRNLLMTVNTNVSEALRTLAGEFGVDLDDRGTKVYDHFNAVPNAQGAVDHTLIKASDMVDSPVITGGPHKVLGVQGQRRGIVPLGAGAYRLRVRVRGVGQHLPLRGVFRHTGNSHTQGIFRAFAIYLPYRTSPVPTRRPLSCSAASLRSCQLTRSW